MTAAVDSTWPDAPLAAWQTVGDVVVLQTQAWFDVPHIVADHDIKTDAGSDVSCFGEFNLGLHVKDQPDAVLANRNRLLASINQRLSNEQRPPVTQIHWLNQVHGQQVAWQTVQRPLPMTAPTADAQWCAQPGRALAIMTADCVPIMLNCTASGRVAAIHAGWQGIANGVIVASVNQLIDDTTNSGRIEAWIGACISQSHYETEADLAQRLALAQWRHVLSSASYRYCQGAQVVKRAVPLKADPRWMLTDRPVWWRSKATRPNKAWLDLAAMAKQQLHACGVKVVRCLPDTAMQTGTSVVDSTTDPTCSYANSRFYSHRRSTHLHQPSTGRMATVILRAPQQCHIP